MFLSFCLPKRSTLISRAFHVGKQFSNPNTEDIFFRAICVNLKQRRWKLLEQMSPSLTNSLVCRVIHEFRDLSQLALEFYNWVGEKKRFSHSLESCCTVIQLLVNSRRFDDALAIMGNLMCESGVPPLEVLEGLINSYEGCDSSPAVFDALVRACTQFGATDGAYEVIMKLRMEGVWVTIHAWNNFLGHLLKLNEIDRFWMLSYGYIENVNTFNLVVHALCKECRLLEAISVFYRMLKNEIWPNIVTFNMIIDGACKMGDLELSLKLVRKMGVMSGGCVQPNSVTYNCVINGFCKIGSVALAEEFRNEMTKVGIESNERTYATLMDGYARGGSLDEAFKLCNEMVERGLIPNSVVYNTVIHWLYKEGDMEGASFLLSDMIDKRICPDQFTYSILAKGLCRNGYVTEALKLNNQIMEKNLIADAFTHNILINYMCRNKNLAGAKQLLGSMFVHGLMPDLVTYGSLIDGHCKEGNVEGAVQVYDGMIKVEEKPNLVI